MEIKNDSNEQKYILNVIDDQIKIINELSNDFKIDASSRNALIEFRNYVDQNWSFNNENYLNVVKANCQGLSDYLEKNKVIEFLLNFSKISCEVRYIYLENGLKYYISVFLAKHKFETNDYNQVLISDFLFDYYYNVAKDKFISGGIDKLYELLKEIPHPHEEIANMVLHSMKNSLFITKEEFSKLNYQLRLG
jgi:hypothetical protein